MVFFKMLRMTLYWYIYTCCEIVALDISLAFESSVFNVQFTKRTSQRVTRLVADTQPQLDFAL